MNYPNLPHDRAERVAHATVDRCLPGTVGDPANAAFLAKRKQRFRGR